MNLKLTVLRAKRIVYAAKMAKYPSPGVLKLR
jgi:hypothetical protein